MRQKYIIWIGLGLALIIAVLLSPFASDSPDGLEKIAEDQGFLKEADEAEAWKDSPAPDYLIPGLSNEGLATGAAGAAGTLMVFALGFIIGKVLKRHRN